MTLVRQVLAHQGGWDEALVVVGPIAVLVAVQWWVRRRQRRGRTRATVAPAVRERPDA